MVEKRTFTEKDLPKNPRIVVWGMTGTGKSVFSNRLLIMYSKNFKSVIMDTKSEYHRYKTLELNDFRSRTFIRSIRTITTQGHTIKNPTIVCEFIAGLLNNYPRTLLYIEEVPLVVPKHIEIYRTLPHIGTLILQGRRFYNGYIAVAQRPAELHDDFVSQCYDTYIFHVRPNDRQLLEKKIGYQIPFEQMDRYEFYSTRDECIFKKIKLVKESRGRSKKIEIQD